MDRNDRPRRPADPYEEEYQRQLEEFSRIAGEDVRGEVDLTMGSADDAFAGYHRDNAANNGTQYTSPAQQDRGNYNNTYNSYSVGNGDGYDNRYDNGYENDRNPRQTPPPQRSGERRVRPEGGTREKRPQRGTSASVRRKEPRSLNNGRPAPERPRDNRGDSPAPRQPQPAKSPKRSEKHPVKRPEKREMNYDREELHFGGRSGGNVPAHEKRHPVRSFFRTLIILLLVIFIGMNALLYYYITLVNRRGRGDRSYTKGSMDSKSVTNILLIGSDTRSESENGRTDSMILMSVNKDRKTITMTSFMRDMYVEIRGRKTGGEDIDVWDKLNAAYVYGGAELLMDTIEYNFDISVDDYVYVDFFSFIDIVDSIGGLEIDITDDEAAGLEDPLGEQNHYLRQPEDTDCLEHGGHLLLNGNQTLAYARLRYVGNADFQRTERQREVIGKIIDKVKSSDPLTVNSFAKALCSDLSTNMSRAEMMLSAYKAVFSLNYQMKTLRLPAEGHYSYGTHGDQSTLDIDIEACRELLRSELY